MSTAMSASPAPPTEALPDNLDALRLQLEAGHIAEVEALCRAWLPHTEGTRRIRLQLQEAGCLQARGRYLDALKSARAAMEAAQAHADNGLRAEALLALGMALQGLDMHADALDALHEAELLAPDAGLLHSRILRRLGVGCSVVGRHEQARELLRRALEKLPADAPAADRWHLSFSLLNVQSRTVDELPRHGPHGDEVARAAYAKLRDDWIDFTQRITPLNLRRLEQMGIGNAGIASLRAGDLEAALHWLTLAGERHREADMQAHLAMVKLYTGDCLNRLGRTREALLELEEALHLMQDGTPRDQIECWDHLAQVYESLGRTSDALKAFKQMRRLERQLADDLARQRADHLHREAEVALLIADWSRRADQDPLTGLANRRAFDRTLAGWLAHPEAAQEGALIIADLDHFKRVNDDYGHQAGDAVLRKVSDILQQFVRKDDLAVRLGGEELGLLVRATGEEPLHEIGERVRNAVQDTDWSVVAEGLAVTLCIGAASLAEVAGETDRAAALFRLADRRLYAAKHAGRNRVVTRDP